MRRASLCLFAVLACFVVPSPAAALGGMSLVGCCLQIRPLGPEPSAGPVSRDGCLVEGAGVQRDRMAAGLEAVQAARDTGWSGQAAVSRERRVHILDGDARGGGHRPGTGLPHKSEFPHGWSDNRIIEAIEDVANDPASARRVGPDGRTVVTGQRQGVDIRVVIDRDGRSIITGYPTNTLRNPR